jgi:uncharacterized membrane protein YcaP (DUF421 family)
MDVLHAGAGWSAIARSAFQGGLIYLAAIVAVRLGQRRFLGRESSFDIVLALLLGPVLARPINGGAPLVATLVATAVLIALHWLVAVVFFHSPHTPGLLRFPAPVTLIEGGALVRENLHRTHLTEFEIAEVLRLHGASSVADVDLACLERNGRVSVVRRKGTPRVVEVAVREGVQTVRIEM